MERSALLTKAEAATRARRSLGGFHQLLAAGKGPRVTRIGREVFIREDDFAAWLDSCSGEWTAASSASRRMPEDVAA